MRVSKRIGVLSSAVLLVIGARADSSLRLVLNNAFRGAVEFLDDVPMANTRAHSVLALSIFPDGGSEEAQAFAAWALGAAIPALSVTPRVNEVLIGPVTVPHQAGCSYCAWQRMIGATADGFLCVKSQEAGHHEVSAIAWQMLVREVRSVIRLGPRYSKLLNHLMAVDVRTHSSWLHRVVPLPFCTICGGAAAFPENKKAGKRFLPVDRPRALLKALAGWVDPRTGVISRLRIESAEETGVQLPIVATASPPQVSNLDGSFRQFPIGWGKGLNVSQAILSAVGEAIERYSASLPDPSRIVWERADDLEGEFLDPQRFPLYSETQYQRKGFPYVRFDRNIRHPWVLGRWLHNNMAVWVHAVFAFLSLALHQENLICQGTSNGLAAATRAEEAALRATLELVERDALMAAWLTARAGQRVEIDCDMDPLLRRVLDGIEALGAAVEIYVLQTSACGTTVLCLALGDGHQYPGVTLGLGTDLDPILAVRRAILELGQTGPHLRSMMRSNVLPTPDAPDCVQDMSDHAAYYFPVERAKEFDRLRSSESPIRFRDLVNVSKAVKKPSLMRCGLELSAAGIRVALIDVTSPDVKTGPFCVSRAVSPDLQPISYGYGFDRLPVDRIQRWGLASYVPAIHPVW